MRRDIFRLAGTTVWDPLLMSPRLVGTVVHGPLLVRYGWLHARNGVFPESSYRVTILQPISHENQHNKLFCAFTPFITWRNFMYTQTQGAKSNILICLCLMFKFGYCYSHSCCCGLSSEKGISTASHPINPHGLNTLWPRNGRHFQDDIFKYILFNECQLQYHCSLFLAVKLTIFQNWFRQWLGAD